MAGFVVLGAIDGVWVARLPALKHRLSLDSGRLGIVIFAVTAAATLWLPLAGWLSARWGSRGPAGGGLLVAATAEGTGQPSLAPPRAGARTRSFGGATVSALVRLPLP